MNLWEGSGLIWGIGGALLLFGVLFNALTSYLHREGYSEGYTWLLVVIGVLVTITAAGPVIGWANVGYLLIFFVASGGPMAAGDIARYARARREAEDRRNGN